MFSRTLSFSRREHDGHLSQDDRAADDDAHDEDSPVPGKVQTTNGDQQGRPASERQTDRGEYSNLRKNSLSLTITPFCFKSSLQSSPARLAGNVNPNAPMLTDMASVYRQAVICLSDGA